MLETTSQELIMLGVDVAKDKLDIAFANQLILTIANTEAGFNSVQHALTNRLKTFTNASLQTVSPKKLPRPPA
jgi:hypothetical protein